MKLELKHLAPYLPYRLKYLDWDCEQFTLFGLELSQNAISANAGKIDFEFITPILSPLSDLTTEETMLFTDSFRMYYRNEKFNPYMLLYKDFELACKMHLDIFKLIPEGLAIDMHTISS